jgi:hypothetical protein
MVINFKAESISGDHSQDGGGLSKEEWKGSGQVPSCSQNAHAQKVLVRCAQ